MICRKCGRNIPDDSNLCPYCGEPAIKVTSGNNYPGNHYQFRTNTRPIQSNEPNNSASSKNNKHGNEKTSKKNTGIIAVCLIFFVVTCISLGRNINKPSDPVVATTLSKAHDESSTKKATTKASATKAPTTSPEKYKSSCEKIAYKDIARTPDKYDGKDVRFTGKVIQVQEGYGNNVIYRISVTKDAYGFWDDAVYVTYKLPEGSPKILEDDIVTFYGECEGTKSYTTVMGSQITIPAVDAKYIVIEQEG